jgi:hypothetical protein
VRRMSATFKASVVSACQFWLVNLRSKITAEAACLPKLFAGVNENFISVTVEGVLVMAGDSIDLAARQAFATYSVADISFLGVRCPKNCPRYHARLVALFWL